MKTYKYVDSRKCKFRKDVLICLQLWKWKCTFWNMNKNFLTILRKNNHSAEHMRKNVRSLTNRYVTNKCYRIAMDEVAVGHQKEIISAWRILYMYLFIEQHSYMYTYR